MEKKSGFRIVVAVGMVLGWITLLLQYYLILKNRQVSVLDSSIRYFSFFTILTNILVALSFTALAFPAKTGWRGFFSRPVTLAGIGVYILLVGLTYNIILRPIWDPHGLQKWVDESLHSVLPIFFAMFWLIFVPKSSLTWKHILPWMVYPLMYILLILALGARSGYYPYPFVDVVRLGYPKVIQNCLLVCLAFFFIAFLFVGFAKWKSKQNSPGA